MPINQDAILHGYLTTIAAWRLSQSDAAKLIGIEASALNSLQSGMPLDKSEEVVARMLMVARMRTALDIYWSVPLCDEWISLPNKGDPYCGLSPLAYIGEHGWPGLFWVLCQVQARAVGN